MPTPWAKAMTIQEAFEEVKKMSDKYVCVSYEMNRYNNGGEEIECKIYINGRVFTAPTFELALEKAKESLG